MVKFLFEKLADLGIFLNKVGIFFFSWCYLPDSQDSLRLMDFLDEWLLLSFGMSSATRSQTFVVEYEVVNFFKFGGV